MKNNVYTTFEKEVSNSCFNKNNYSVNAHVSKSGVDRFISSFTFYTDSARRGESVNVEDFFEKAVPGFQRANNKWSQDMKIKFVENVFKGFRPEIKLFNILNKTVIEDSQIIDGLQRLTAITDFMAGKFKIFKTYTYEDIQNYEFRLASMITIQIYTFDTWEEVLKFYVDINENITHSKEDIQKAKDWFLAEKGIDYERC
jgi:hypothetical protein